MEPWGQQIRLGGQSKQNSHLNYYFSPGCGVQTGLDLFENR